MRRATFPPVLSNGRPLLAAGLLLLLTGCAAQTVGGPPVRGSERETAERSPRARPVPAAPAAASLDEAPGADVQTQPLVEPMGDPYASVAVGDAAMAHAVRVSREHWELARSAFQAGDIDRARDEFDRAVDVFDSGEIAKRSEAESLVDALTTKVAAYETAWAESREQMPASEEEREVAPVDALSEVDLPETATPPQPVAAVPGSRLAHDIPLEVNNQVLYMLEVYRGRLKDEITPAFVRSGRYLPMIQAVFKEEGIPQDLAWLALVESGFKPHAYSSAAAKGLWQFIRATGRTYGLDSDFWVDERSDPEKATRAAARHLKDLHDRYGDWYLALAAYNAGAGKVDRAVRRVGRKDYWEIASTRHLMRETKNYVPAFLATLLIVEDPAKHGFDFTPELPWTFERVEVEGPADLEVLARCAGTSTEEIRRLNPELRRGTTPGSPRTYSLRIPTGTRPTFELAYAQLPAGERLRFARHSVARGESVAKIARQYGLRLDAVLEANGLAKGSTVPPGSELRIPVSDGFSAPAGWSDYEPRARRSATSRGAVHVVRRGETLSSIASRYGLSIAKLRQMNDLRSSNRIAAGSRLRVRTSSSSAGSAPATRTRSSAPAPVTHRVRRGETLSVIAGRYGVSIRDLTRWNGRGVARLLQAGQTLKVFPTSR